MKRRRLWLVLAVLALIIGFLMWWGQGVRRYDGVIQEAARRYQVEPALVKAVVWRESRFSWWARGKAEEIGLMQIRLPVAQEWAQAEHRRPLPEAVLYNPSINVRVGAWYLGKLLKRYAPTDEPVVYALADYNAGRSNVLRWNRGLGARNSSAFLAQMDFPGTRAYITAILARREEYRRFWPSGRR